MARDQVCIALPVRLPGNGGLRLCLLWQPCLVLWKTKCRAHGHIQLYDRLPLAPCVRKGHKDQRLTHLPIGRLRVATIPVPVIPIVSIVSIVSIVVVLCVLHMLAMTTKRILSIGARYLDTVVCISLRHIQLVARAPGAAGQRQRKQRVRVWAGERGLGKQAG